MGGHDSGLSQAQKLPRFLCQFEIFNKKYTERTNNVYKWEFFSDRKKFSEEPENENSQSFWTSISIK